MLPLIPEDIDAALFSLLDALADRVHATAREYLRCLEEGQDLSRASERRDVDNFLMTIDRLSALGRDTSIARRAFTAAESATGHRAHEGHARYGDPAE